MNNECYKCKYIHNCNRAKILNTPDCKQYQTRVGRKANDGQYTKTIKDILLGIVLLMYLFLLIRCYNEMTRNKLDIL